MFLNFSNSQLRLGRFSRAPYTDGPSPFWNWPHPLLLDRHVDCHYEVWMGVAVFHRGQSTVTELLRRLYLYPCGAEWNLRLVGMSLRLVTLCRVLFQQHRHDLEKQSPDDHMTSWQDHVTGHMTNLRSPLQERSQSNSTTNVSFNGLLSFPIQAYHMTLT